MQFLLTQSFIIFLGLLLSTKGLSDLMCINYHVNLTLSSAKIKKRLIVLKIRRYLTVYAVCLFKKSNS